MVQMFAAGSLDEKRYPRCPLCDERVAADKPKIFYKRRSKFICWECVASLLNVSIQQLRAALRSIEISGAQRVFEIPSGAVFLKPLPAECPIPA